MHARHADKSKFESKFAIIEWMSAEVDGRYTDENYNRKTWGPRLQH